MQKYRCLWIKSSSNHNILCYVGVPGNQNPKHWGFGCGRRESPCLARVSASPDLRFQSLENRIRHGFPLDRKKLPHFSGTVFHCPNSHGVQISSLCPPAPAHKAQERCKQSFLLCRNTPKCEDCGEPGSVRLTPVTQPLHWKPVPHPQPVTLAGRTVTLEPLDAEKHAAALWQAIQGYDSVWQWLFDGPYADEDSFRAAIAAKQSAPGFVSFAIVPRSTGQASGYASYLRIEPAHGVIEVGNILLSPSLQRTTAATEAMYLMARHVFEGLKYRRYEWKCNALNEPSRRAALRLGFTYEGIFRQHMIVKDCNRDTAWFSMLDHEWPARKHAFEAWLSPANLTPEGAQRRPLADFAI